MIKHTGDEDVLYAVAVERDMRTGELNGLKFTYTREQASEIYDEFGAHALLKVTIEVLSSVDGEIQPTKGNS